MSARVLPLGRAIGTFALTFLCSAPIPVVGIVSAHENATAVAEHYYPEVRLRKLHLVRPDLIPYPLTFDIYC